MSAPDTNGGDRSTVALAIAEIRGLKDLQTSEFANVQRQLDSLTDVPVKVAELKGEVRDLGRRVDRIESDKDNTNEWRRGPALLAGVTLIIAFINILQVAGAIHFG